MAKKENILQKYVKTFVDESEKFDKDTVFNFEITPESFEYVDSFIDADGYKSMTHIMSCDFDKIVWYCGQVDNPEEIHTLLLKADFQNQDSKWYYDFFQYIAYRAAKFEIGVFDSLAEHKKNGSEKCDLEYCNMHTQKT